MKILISMPEKLTRDLDTYCQNFHFERSELIRSLIRDRIYGTPGLDAEKIVLDDHSALPETRKG